jgi:DNA modification methylase
LLLAAQEFLAPRLRRQDARGVGVSSVPEEKKSKDRQRSRSRPSDHETLIMNQKNAPPPLVRSNKSLPTKRANELDGKHWVKYSISVWSDIRFSAEERALKHPAMFPQMLAERLIQCFTSSLDKTVLDPFCGSGSTLLAASKLGKHGVGFEIYPKFIRLAKSRLKQCSSKGKNHFQIIKQDARTLSTALSENSIDFCVTSPPYWDILRQRRTADHKQRQTYGEKESDIGNISSYEQFLAALATVAGQIHRVLKDGKYLVMNVMDLRKGPIFFPLHIHTVEAVERAGFFLDDIIIWDRRMDYNSLRALGYPAVFRINKVHEFLLIFRKPRSEGTPP